MQPILSFTWFVEAAVPEVAIFGFVFDVQPLGIAFGLIVLPFAIGILARRQLVFTVVAFAALLMIIALEHVILLGATRLQASPVAFPWHYLARWMLWSIPAVVAGYLTAVVLKKQRVGGA
jgi:hypothetical protein